MMGMSDPVGFGPVANLARPGGPRIRTETSTDVVSRLAAGLEGTAVLRAMTARANGGAPLDRTAAPVRIPSGVCDFLSAMSRPRPDGRRRR